MGIFKRKNKKNIELKQDISGYLVFPYPLRHDVVFLNHNAVVPENTTLAFATRGKILDFLPSGTHTLTPALLPKANKKFKLSKLDKYGEVPDGFNGFAYFVNLATVQNFAFGTYKKIRYHNELDGRFWIKMHFVADLQVEDAELLLKSLVRQLAILRANEPEDIVAMWLSEFVTDQLQKNEYRKNQFAKPRVQEIAELLGAKLVLLLEDVGLRLLAIRVLEVEFSGKKSSAKNPLLSKQKNLSQSNKILQNMTNQDIKLSPKQDIIFEESEYNSLSEENQMHTNYENHYNDSQKTHEEIENDCARLEEEAMKKWIGWEKFLKKD